jgi:aquaporin Z
VLVTVAAGSGVINHYVGGGPISRTAAVIAPGAVVMAMIYAWGPLSGLHINPTDYTGWWVYIAGPVVGAAIAVAIIGLVRGLPDRSEREAAEGGALPITGADGAQPTPSTQDPAGGVA